MSNNIVLARIDDRLIHGQVMTAWLQEVKATEIVIIDNDTASSSFLSTIMKQAVPSETEVTILNEEDAIDYLKNEDNNNKLLLLAKTPFVFEKIISNDISIDELNVGGIGAKPGRSKLYRNISASDEEKEALKKINSGGTDVFIQVIPSDKRIEYADIN